MAENKKEAKGFVYGVLQSIGGSVMLSLCTAMWDKVKHGSVDWLGIGGLFALAVVVFFLLFWFFWRRLPATSPLKAEQGVVGVPSSRLKILWAHYGAEGGPVKEVGEEYLRPRICGNCLVGWVGSDLFGPLDPAIGLQKQLRVRYSFDDKEVTISRPDHALLVLPEDKFLKDQIEECRRERELEKSQFNSDLSRAQEGYRQCEHERREAKAKLDNFTSLQLDALILSLHLLLFIEAEGTPPRPKYTKEQIDGMPQSERQRLRSAADGDFLYACERHFGPESAEAQCSTAAQLEALMLGSMRVLDPWHEKIRAGYELKFKGDVELLCNKLAFEGIPVDKLRTPVHGAGGIESISTIAFALWEIGYKLKEQQLKEKGIKLEAYSVRKRLTGEKEF